LQDNLLKSLNNFESDWMIHAYDPVLS
jgi:hypothetical protein